MPSLFARRRGSTGQVHHNAPVSSAAATAASSAFLRNSASTATLSSAAAAAALRSHTTTPEPISHIQTKRMVRRGSQSSNGSGSVITGQGQRPVVRRSSQGSMTERSFRSPSPGRASPHALAPRPAAEDAPPVPAMPVSRPVSRTAAQPSVTPRAKPAPVKVYQPTGLPAQELDKDGSNRSVNFSRPMSPSADDSPVSPTRPKTQGSWFGAPTEINVAPRQSVLDRPKSAASISPGTKSGIEAGLQSVARSPSKKKKQKASAQAPGAKLAKGTLNTTPYGTAVQSSAPSHQQSGEQQQKTSEQPRNTESPKANPVSAPVEPATADADASDSDRRRTSPSPSSNARRPIHTLNKQPSVVMEEPESDKDDSWNRKSQDSPYPALSPTPRSQQRSQFESRSRQASVVSTVSSAGSPPQRFRPASLEVPEHQRSAHFGANLVDTPSGIRHNPPPRSVSPAKSALKHSPSSSIRTNSPGTTFTPLNKPSGSDTSDTMSMTSQDGIKAAKRKKSVRVSFDDAPKEEQLHTNGRKGSKGSSSPALSDGDLDDEIMKPRPALPSFGSVRTSTPRRSQPEPPEKVTETLQESTLHDRTLPQGASSDHAVGSILVNAHSRPARDENEPLPPEVTSVEGTGQLSDNSESSDDDDDEESTKGPSRRQSAMENTSVGATSAVLHVPDIQVLPATPATEEAPTGATVPQDNNHPADVQPKPTRKVIPGSWDDAEDDDGTVPADETQQASSSGEIFAAEPPDESDSDDSAAFSDAAEDPSELDPYGYASLDAIVESPVPPTSHKSEQAMSPAVSTPLLDSSSELGTPGTDSKDWTHTSAYWSSQKAQLQRRESDQLTTEEPAPALAQPKVKKTKQKPKPVVEQDIDLRQSKPKTNATNQAQRPAKQMRGSMREAPPIVAEERPTTFRKSMRGPPPEPQRPKSQQLTSTPRSALQQKTMRPASAGGSSTRQTPVLAQKPQPSTVVPTNDSDSESSFRRKPRRGSASDSGRYTMKRSMRSASVDTDRERRPSSSQAAAPSAGRWSLRSLSPPPDSPQPGRNQFRTSLRGTSIPEGPTLRGNNSIAKDRGAKSSGKFSMSGFSRASKSPSPVPVSAPTNTKKSFKSRFADSDSEAEASAPARRANSGFRSRFADSDDEDDQPRHMPADLTPVRGIPRTPNTAHEDSTDLDDSSDDDFSRRRRAKRDSGRTVAKPIVPSQTDIEKAMATARQNVASMTGNQSLLEPSTPKGKVQKRVTLQTDPLSAPASPASKTDAPITRRKGLLGSLFGRRNSSSSLASVNSARPGGGEMSPPASPSSPRGKLQRRHAPKLQRAGSAQSGFSVASASSAAEAEGVVVNENGAGAKGKAMPSLREDDEDGTAVAEADKWPLTPLERPTMPAALAEEERPASSDGVTESGRVKMMQARPKLERRSISGAEVGKGGGGNNGLVTKKKRFGRLRRAFGLHD
ncbi:Transcription factor RAX1 [Sphaceloma murrayae]|uniref:Transcription factor RAX1 n=1 Tax=Sphaceloma murrayae TaxID=2082308 RepID=A0A2K1QYP3_9PEZI|nr:Transcription factor RAX1 [Sphaceloma murrayae]